MLPIGSVGMVIMTCGTAREGPPSPGRSSEPQRRDAWAAGTSAIRLGHALVRRSTYNDAVWQFSWKDQLESEPYREKGQPMTTQILLHAAAPGHLHFELIAAVLGVTSLFAFGAAWRRRSSLRK